MRVESNFHAWLEDENGLLVPGSAREGHNVFTDHGREWLKQLVSLVVIGDLDTVDDEPADTRRFRWIGVGEGSVFELTSVEQLAAPLSLSLGPTRYLRELGTRTHPIDSSVKFQTTFLGSSTDLDHHGLSVTIREAGIFVDVNDGSGPELDPALSTHTPVAYKTFAPITKISPQSLILTWEFRF